VIVIRLFCAAYWLFLTVLLLTPDPRGLLGLEPVAHLLPNAKVVHVLCFTLLGFVVQASRFPLRRVPLAALLAGYAFAAEALQHFVPNRTARVQDFLLNLVGLALGTALWWGGRRVSRIRNRQIQPTEMEARTMNGQERFRIRTADRVLSYDTFLIAAQQPANIKADCLLAVNERDGSRLTVHSTRLIPVEPKGKAVPPSRTKSRCLKCGKVEGIVADEVVCPHAGDIPCGLLEAATEKPQDSPQ